MASHGIKDRVAIVGMGCTRFAEAWDRSADDLLREAAADAFASAGTTQEATDAFWLGTAQSGMSGIMLARALGLEGKPVTRVENYCATGSEALRQAAYAVASGAYDSAMAIGVDWRSVFMTWHARDAIVISLVARSASAQSAVTFTAKSTNRSGVPSIVPDTSTFTFAIAASRARMAASRWLVKQPPIETSRYSPPAGPRS